MGTTLSSDMSTVYTLPEHNEIPERISRVFVAELYNYIAQLSHTNKQLCIRIKTLNNGLKTYKDTIERVNGANITLEQHIERLQSSISQADIRTTDLLTQIDVSQKQQVDLTQKICNQTAINCQLEQSIERYKQAIENMKHQMSIK